MSRLYAISGAAGMTGSELVYQILADSGNGDRILGFDNFFASSIDTIAEWVDDGRFDFFAYDINDRGQMADFEKRVLQEKTDYDEVVYINCAAVVHTEYFYRVEDTFQTNVAAMKDFLEQAIRVGAGTFINCSSSEVYSMQSWNESGGVREADYLVFSSAEHSQRTSYAAGKLLTEFFLKDAVDRGQVGGCSIRFANVYSKNERYPKHIIPHIIRSLRESGKVVLLENAKKNRRTFLNNFDSCSAVLALINTDSALDGTVYNVATDEEIAIVDLVKLCAEKMGIAEPKLEFAGYRKSDPERRLLCTEKIRQRTGWKPVVGLSEGLDECIRFMGGVTGRGRRL